MIDSISYSFFNDTGNGPAAPALKAEPGLKKGCARKHGATRRSPGGREKPSNVDRAEENGYLEGEARMNKETLSKLTDFLVNFAVACFAVSAFQGVWWGIVPGITSLAGVFILGKRLGGK